MSADKRTVATDALETLGMILAEGQKRDAIHLAVEPVVAEMHLRPGDHIRIANGFAHRTEVGKGHGIVDPFLIHDVRKGERFWFVMYPRQVHSLRHVWTHPDFPDEPGTSAATPAPAPPAISKEESKAWLQAFCATSDCPAFSTVMELLETGNVCSEGEDVCGHMDEEYLHFSGLDAHGEIPPEFWVHAENLLGRKLQHHPTYFSCSC